MNTNKTSNINRAQGNTVKPIIGWRDGQYFYCISHARTQVSSYKLITEDEEGFWAGRKCDWCKKKIKGTAG